MDPMSFCSHGHSLRRGVHKTKVVVYVPNCYLVRLDTPTLPLGSKGGQKGTRWGSGASAEDIGRNFVKQKLLGTSNLVGVGHLLGPQIRIWKDLGPVYYWSHGASFPRRVYKIKVVV